MKYIILSIIILSFTGCSAINPCPDGYKTYVIPTQNGYDYVTMKEPTHI